MKTKTSDLEDLNKPECREIGTALAVLARHLRMQAAADCAGELPQEVEEQCKTLEVLADGFRRSYSLPYRLGQLVKALNRAVEDPDASDEPFPIMWPVAYLQTTAEALRMLGDLLKQSKDDRAARIARLAELTGEAVKTARVVQEMHSQGDGDAEA